MCLALLTVLAAAALALFQSTITKSVFEWGQVKDFSGVLKAKPYPHLIISRPDLSALRGGVSAYYLVSPWKFGFDPEAAMRLDGKSVSLKGTLIYRDNQTMIEAIPSSIRAAATHNRALSISNSVFLGRKTLRGEIVDSKCYLGVMNPGQFIPHRACAIRCISGGVPPILVVQRENEVPLHFLLVATDGSPVNRQVLELVAEPVEIIGDVEQEGDLFILRADPSTYRRI